MTVHKTIALSEEDAAFLERAVAEGRYASPSDAVREALALLADAERVEALREAIAEGEASGEPEPFDIEEFLARAVEEDAALPTDVVRYALGRLREGDGRTRLDRLRAAIAEGEASGFEEEAFNFEQFLDDLHGRR
ncbi:type II toxin-antitoxin system ParD family antitoxin [Salinarimonas rosea]|uniref:type II toxin-antitoxin system ParD family antitoxin n=1 Tax=Salinarimonas rosea TaxID=552063 RepID=UPI00042A2C5E|nr:type II toxin-antitoxin system ParD family antitoxin [Salinarimonas rosea]